MGIAEGMSKLHEEGIIHRDLKTSNVLVKYDERYQKYIGKVCDFGSARKLDTIPDVNNNKNHQKGSSMWSHNDSKSRNSSHLTHNGQHHHGIFHFFKHGDEKQMDINESLQSNNTVTTSRMTTQVGTIAFMAPELLSKIDISTLMPGGFMPQSQQNSLKKKIATKNEDKNEDYHLMTEMTEKNNANNKENNDKKVNNLNDIENVNKNKNGKAMGLFESLTNKLVSSTNNDNIHDHHATNDFVMVKSPNNGYYYDEEYEDDGKHSLYDKSVDVFAFGIMMYEIGFLKRIYENMGLIDIYQTITNDQRMNIPSYQQCQDSKLTPRSGFYIVSEAVYEEYIKLMKLCWSQKPENRPTFHEIKLKLDEIENVRCGRNF